MFQAGDVIVCGTHGVCRVECVGPLDGGGISRSGVEKGRIYYTLVPVYEKESVVFTPVDNQKIVIRPVLSREKALDLIDGMPTAEMLTITDEKRRETEYREALYACQAEALVKVLKTIYARRRTRLARGKKATDADSRYMKLAEDCLYGELAVSLGLERDQVRGFIRDRIGTAE
ncbi:CarD family transcriptional regulator [Lachnoclostridium sp. An14]|uniref:CarD family transcriptional regulator n=1 Tax=Lachnoclostridium sp. An14 TaxID=1965562 RepID=UPI000B389AA1|nr:CarD family transcriptional regulator [Lachnoclostridium sp. An14]OUQ17838.1 CarD family transcriptional regulator [Lachnoclostridium sp. An14]